MFGPDHEYAYLNDQLPESHPEFAKYDAMYKDSVEGKRLKKFRKQNDDFCDGLNTYPPNRLDLIMREEGVNFTGDPMDRIGKIMAIREKRMAEEKEKLRGMKPEERKAYLAEKEESKVQQTPQSEQDQKEFDLRQEERNARRSAMEQAILKKIEERNKQRDEGRKFLDEEAAVRQGIKPTELRKKAMEELEQAGEIEEETIETGLPEEIEEETVVKIPKKRGRKKKSRR